MTSPLLQFIASMVIVTGGWALFILLHHRVNPITYFSSQTGLGILKGIVLAIAFAASLALLGNQAKADEVKWFKEAEVFAGIDQTFNTSPQCVNGGIDDRATSNLGLRLSIYENGPFRIGSKYTHHSCAFGEDAKGYDALGIELVYRFWSR